MTDHRLTQLEETAAHLTQVVDDLSDIVARQEREIAVLKRRLQVLLEREAERQYEAGGSMPLADQKPPHW
ncbi:SlyX family protein [Pseudaestuariivita rosea]|uniref:SlyX family protein n=1 Tax=Pseudaestuariivita rosea TaxID=2763263 RepID=UPI001ABA1838|nr:SlyX family protein [Pseudaestuariivita rosea]